MLPKENINKIDIKCVNDIDIESGHGNANITYQPQLTELIHLSNFHFHFKNKSLVQTKKLQSWSESQSTILNDTRQRTQNGKGHSIQFVGRTTIEDEREGF